MGQTHFRTATIDGLDVFYREAGAQDAPAVLLLHRFPTSSHSFRDLIPVLADRYRVVAPDYIGFGYSSMPSVTEFSYTFDALTDVTAKLLDMLNIRRYAVYMHDYGAPVGLRLLLRQPDAVKAIITQSGNAYAEGFVEEFWKPLLAYAKDSGPQTEPAARKGLTLEATRKQQRGRLAGRDAGDRAPGTPAPRCAAVAVRRGRRLALHRLRHQHHRGAVAVAGGPPLRPCPSRRPHPLRQGHGPSPAPLARVRHQCRLVHRRRDRRGPARLAADPRPLDRDLATAEPKRLRYRVLHTTARLIRGQRQRWLRIHSRWPWADQITAAFTRIAAISAPG